MQRVNKLSFLVLALLLGLIGCNSGSVNTNSEVVEIVYGRDFTFVPPQPYGQYQVGTQQFHWIDESRAEPHTATTSDHREVLVRLFYPSDLVEGLKQLPLYNAFRWPFWKTANDIIAHHQLRQSNYLKVDWPVFVDAPLNNSLADYPLIIFSHGLGFSPEEHLLLAADLASRGFIVASINHPFGSSRMLLSSGQEVYAQALPENNLGVDLGLWSDDQIFVINKLIEQNNDADSFLYQHINLLKIATSGHSYGGAAAFHSAAKDDRIRAAIDIDGSIFNADDKYLNIPFMLMQSGSGDSYEIFNHVANDGYGIAFKKGIKHHSFADYVLFWRSDFPEQHPFGSLDGELALKTSADVIEQFLKKYFDGATAPLLDDPQQRLDFLRVETF